MMKKPKLPFVILSILNPNSIKKNNLDKNYPYNGLEHDISSLRKGDIILLMGDFNARTSSNQAILLSNYSCNNSKKFIKI